LWDLRDYRPLGKLTTGSLPFAPHLEFNDDGKQIIVTGGQGPVVLWDIDVQRWESAACDIVEALTQGTTIYSPNSELAWLCT
jgi:hypothetical protein